jgi:copper chaperone CopZ
METIRIEVDGMTCGHCTARVERALREVDGVEEARVDLQGAEIRGRAERPELLAAIREAGYEPRI